MVGLGIRVGLSTVASFGPPAMGASYYVASTGDDGDDGSIGSPWATLKFAATQVAAGATVWVMDDLAPTVFQSSTVGLLLDADGTSGSPITYRGYPAGTRRTVDFTAWALANNTCKGVKVDGDYTHIRDLHVTNMTKTAPNGSLWLFGVEWNGTNGHLFNSEVSNIQGIGLAWDGPTEPTNLHLENSDFHHCSDPQYSYGNADGLQLGNGAHSTTGIVVEGCRFWANSDDGVDLYFCQAPVTFIDCWSFNNGFQPDGTTLAGDGTGFKLGGATYSAAHSLTRCLAFDNGGSGFSTNDGTAAMTLTRCTAIDNGRAGNAYPAAFIADGSATATLAECVKYGAYANYLGGGVTESYNSWNTPPGITVTSAHFQTVTDETGATDSRGSGGALPDLAIGRPEVGSALLTAGPTSGPIGSWDEPLDGYVPPASPPDWDFLGESASVSAVTSDNLTLTAPVTAVAGDLWVASIATRGNVGFSAPSGWTIAQQVSGGNTSTTASTAIAGGLLAYIVLPSSSTPDLTFTRTAGDAGLGRIAAYRPTEGSTIALVDSSIREEASNTTTPGCAGVTTDAENNLVISACFGADNYVQDKAVASGITISGVGELTSAATPITPEDAFILISKGTTSNGADTALAIAHAVVSAPGATGTISWTVGSTSRAAVAAAAFSSSS